MTAFMLAVFTSDIVSGTYVRPLSELAWAAGFLIAASVAVPFLVILEDRMPMSRRQQWVHRLQAMKRCRTATALIKKYGEPIRKEQHETMDIWHYPLGETNTTSYSMHINVAGDQVLHVYMYTVVKMAADPDPKPSEAPEAEGDPSLRNIAARVNRQGDVNDPTTPRPLLTLEEFFEGNQAIGSICPNCIPTPEPAIVYGALRRIRSRPDVADIRVEITAFDTPEWPFSDTVWIITSAAPDVVRTWFDESFAPDTCEEGWGSHRPREPIATPAGMRPIHCWWD